MASVLRFVRLWFVLFFAYFCAKFVFNIIALGWIDLRAVSLAELAVVPAAQAVFVRLIILVAPISSDARLKA